MRLFPEHVFWHPPTPASQQVFLPGTRLHYPTLIIFQRMRNCMMNPTVVSRTRHLAPHTCVYFSFFIRFFLLTSGIQCYTRPTHYCDNAEPFLPHHYCDHAGPFGNTTTGGGKTVLRAPGGMKAECSNHGATHTPLWRHGLNDESIVTLVDCIANWWVFSFRFGCIQPCFVYREFTPPAFFIGRFANVHLTCSISVHAKNLCARVTARGDEVACRRCFVFFKPPHALRMKQLGTA
jgi:hypothetical protein